MNIFNKLDEVLNLTCNPPSPEVQKQAQARQNQLTKPPGSLGKLEEMVVWLAGCQNSAMPQVQQPWITIFAADHGITEENISAFPPVVTQEMVKNFIRGGAAISVIARAEQAQFEVVDAGIFQPISLDNDLKQAAEKNRFIEDRVAAGTANFSQQPAMTKSQLLSSLNVGARAVQRAVAAEADIFIGGEMGIGNTTAATALICQQTSLSPAEAVGAGTGLPPEQLPHKQQVIENALKHHSQHIQTPLDALQTLGGFEIAALAGAYLAAARVGLPVLVDGVISSAAALIAVQTQPQVAPWLCFAHQSVEPAQQAVFQKLQVAPILNLEMRLGEGSGAASLLPLIKLACTLHQQMATFEEAAVSTAESDA